MAAIPQSLHSLASAIYRWWEVEGAKEGPRPHLGASLIGHACARHLWFTFRWAVTPKWEGRMLRLFNRGQREEALIVRELRGIGAEVSECQPDGTQWRVEALGGHFGGSMDGIARKLPGGSATNWEVLEFKTHNARSYKDVADRGVEKSKPQHWAQMQVYMALTGMTRANYIAICKDDDQIHHERVHAAPDAGRQLMERAEQIVFSPEPLTGVSQNPAWYQCKGCHHEGLCHATDAPQPTCRTCTHVTPTRDGKWLCERHNRALGVDEQIAACDGHRFIPALLSSWADYQDGDQVENWARYTNKLTGATFMNGSGPDQYTSMELHVAADKRMVGDAGVQQFKIFGGRMAG
jgi:hypothetical protein